MDEIIARITSEDPNRSLPQLLSMPLGLDVWESKPERLVLRATEAVLDRIGKMGYRVEPVVAVSEHLTPFAARAAAEGFHTAESLEQDMRELAAKRPELVDIKEIGRSLENRPILALRIGERKPGVRKLLFMGCHHAREWLAVEVPFLLARELIERADEAPIAGWLGNGEIWIAPMVNPDGHAFCETITGSGARTGAPIRTARSASIPIGTTATCGACSTSTRRATCPATIPISAPGPSPSRRRERSATSSRQRSL